MDVAELEPTIEIKTVDTEPPTVVCLRPNALVAALAVPADNLIKISNSPVSFDLFNELGKDFWNRDKRYLVSNTPRS